MVGLCTAARKIWRTQYAGAGRKRWHAQPIMHGYIINTLWLPRTSYQACGARKPSSLCQLGTHMATCRSLVELAEPHIQAGVTGTRVL